MSRGRSGVLVAVLAIALALGAVPATRAEHTPHHRYFIQGVVTNDLGQPVCGVVVRASDVTSPKADGSNDRTATTDASGHYEIQLHEHDGIGDAGPPPGDLNNTVRVSVASSGQSQTVKLAPNAGNANGWGELSVSFALPTRDKGSCLSFAELVLYAGLAIGVILLIVFLVFFVRRPRRMGQGDLRKVQGVGRSRARELEGMGIRSVHDLAEADPRDLAKNSTLTPKQAKALVKRASDAQAATKR